MKVKASYPLLLLGILLTCSGCKKFLEEENKDELKPTTTQNLTSIMAAEAYPYQTNLHLLLNIISDDVDCNGGQGMPAYESVVRTGRSPFSWSPSMFEDLLLPDGLSNTSCVNSWEILYKCIAGCNVVLEYADQVSGSQAEKENLKGQAFALRGYYYFLLVNLFGKPYNSSDPERDPGVPLKLEMKITDELYKRNSIAEVYRQIEADLMNAADLLGTYPKENGIYKMNQTAAYCLLSRVYLYQEKWDLVIEYANKALSSKSELSQLSSFRSDEYYKYNINTNNNDLNRIYDPEISKEIIWAYKPINYSYGGEGDMFKNVLSPGFSPTNKPPYAPSASLMNLYDSRGLADNDVYLADLRPRIYFCYSSYSVAAGSFFSRGYCPIAGGMGGAGIRVAELYLNRAEASIHKFIQTGDDIFRLNALKDINTLRMSRFDQRRPYISVNMSSKDELLNFYKDERRREFPFDGHRWFDLRRYGMPSITHYYEEKVGSKESLTLVKGDRRYTLPIPKAALDRNPALIQNH